MHDIDRFISAKDVPITWQMILQDVRNITGTEAILAGGALRDLIHKQVPKDIDIFVFHGKNMYQFNQAFKDAGWTLRKSQRDHSTNSRSPDSRGYVDDQTYYSQGLIINLISYLPEENKTLFENFDISSSMIMFDGLNVISDPSFADFVENKNVKIINNMRRTNERLDRLSDRYQFKVDGVDRDHEDEIPF